MTETILWGLAGASLYLIGHQVFCFIKKIRSN